MIVEPDFPPSALDARIVSPTVRVEMRTYDLGEGAELSTLRTDHYLTQIVSAGIERNYVYPETRAARRSRPVSASRLASQFARRPGRRIERWRQSFAILIG